MSTVLEASSRDAGSPGCDPRLAPGGAAEQVQDGKGEERRVLLVDDEENILSSLRRLLRREKFKLITASNGREALKVMEAEPAHVVISDYRMPGMTGTELLREIQSRWPDTVRIVLSGYSEVKAIIAAVNEGAIYKFMSKPWKDEEILLNVRRAVEQYDLLHENARMAHEIAAQNERLLELNRLLEERASDASAGRDVTQELFEIIDAGVIIIDLNGLIVGGNQRAWEHLQAQESIGMPADAALPAAMYEPIHASGTSGPRAPCGRLELNGRTLQWRARPIGEGDQYRGQALTLWEEVE